MRLFPLCWQTVECRRTNAGGGARRQLKRLRFCTRMSSQHFAPSFFDFFVSTSVWRKFNLRASSCRHFCSSFRKCLSPSIEIAVTPCSSFTLFTFVNFCNSENTSFLQFPSETLSLFYTVLVLWWAMTLLHFPLFKHRKVDFLIFEVFHGHLPFVHFSSWHLYTGSGGGR